MYSGDSGEKNGSDQLPLCATSQWAAGIAICALYVFATTELSGAADIAMAVFTSVTQGILVTGLATVVCRVTGKDKNGTEGDNRKQEKEEKQTADDTQHSAVPENTKEQQDK